MTRFPLGRLEFWIYGPGFGGWGLGVGSGAEGWLETLWALEWGGGSVRVLGVSGLAFGSSSE